MAFSSEIVNVQTTYIFEVYLKCNSMQFELEYFYIEATISNIFGVSEQ